MLNFTVGPVMSSEAVRAIGAEQVPYFRTAEFSEVMFENEALMKKFAKASDDSRVAFITGSSSAGMETAIMNTLTPNDKAIVVNGGSFGQRFVELLQLHEIPFKEIKLEPGKALKPEHPTTASAYDIFLKIKDEYGMWICPNGGSMKDTVFRVGHIGALTKADYDKLIAAFKDLQRKGII